MKSKKTKMNPAEALGKMQRAKMGVPPSYIILPPSSIEPTATSYKPSGSFRKRRKTTTFQDGEKGDIVRRLGI